MDSLTHSLIGAAIARTGLRERCGPGTTLALVLGSNLPDLDGGCTFLTDGFLLRRSLTHSFWGVPALSLLLAAVLAFAFRRRDDAPRTGTLFWLVLCGAALHVFFDLLNSYGVMLLSPFSWSRFELGWVFIVDVFMLVWLALPFAIPRVLALVRGSGPARRDRLAPHHLARVVVAGVAFYVGLCGTARALSMQALVREAPGASFSYVFPEPFGPHRFRGVARSGNTWRVFLVRPFAGTVTLHDTIVSDEDDPRVRAARQTPRAQRLATFFKAPVWRVKDGAPEVFDLRFRTIVLSREPVPFTIRFEHQR